MIEIKMFLVYLSDGTSASRGKCDMRLSSKCFPVMGL